MNFFNKYSKEEILKYLKGILENLYIDANGKSIGRIMSLMPHNSLEGYCFNVTEAAICFFDDDAYVARGYLNLDENSEEYAHAWIVFKYRNIEYVFDPCLNYIEMKENYYKKFKVKEKAIIYSIDFKKAFFNLFEFPKYNVSSEGDIIGHLSIKIDSPFYQNTSIYTVSSSTPWKDEKGMYVKCYRR